MSKVALTEQVSEAKCLDLTNPRQAAILATLEWMQANEPDIRAYIAHKRAVAEAREHPAVKNVLEVFPEAQIEGVVEAD